MRRFVTVLLLVIVCVAAVFWLRRDTAPPQTATDAQPLRTLSADELLGWSEKPDRAVRLRTIRDVIPGGYTAAMAPLFVDWEMSDPVRDGYAVLRNVNYGGNPFEGTTQLCSARIPLGGVIAAEFILVPLGARNRPGPMSHGQLRFIFAPETPITLLDFEDAAGLSDATLSDLVISWEAWRPPGVDYDVLVGMDSAAYLLSPRLYAGPQRFLEDALAGRDWFAHQLRMPGGREGLTELLAVSLAVADGVARHNVSRLFEQEEAAWLRHHPPTTAPDDEDLQRWEELRERVKPYKVSEDPLIDLPAADRTYQTLVRSCASLALYTVDVTAHRLVTRGLDDGVVTENLVQPRLTGTEPWMAEVADADLFGVFLRAPAALRFLVRNPQMLPNNIPGYLAEAGLLQTDAEGKHRTIHYSPDDITPYGKAGANLIR